MPTKRGGKQKKIEPANAAEAVIGKFYQPHHVAARRLMLLGVTCCTILIAVLWGWAIKLRLESVTWKKTNEGQLVSDVKQNWDKSFSEEKNATEVRATSVREGIQTAVGNLLASEAASSSLATSSTTSTTENTTTSPAVTTTTKTKK